ncbi:energy transducer TonB [Salinispirillum sp. LH 10-3-1]|uniref:Energy transducer TonB n=1 Tax=Salinispirillum sp. LH 10-3-1 TaxID=2952525 RepID=A0AB38YFZ4_9GAMM
MSTNITEARVSAYDRVLFTGFIALVLHAFVILGITFDVTPSSSPRPTMEVTLALQPDNQRPNDDADFLAQASQEGSGTLDERERITTDQMADFDDNVVREVEPAPMTASAPLEPLTQRLIVAYGEASWGLAPLPEPEDVMMDAPDIDITQTSSMDIATLRAMLDTRRQNYANRPRVRTLTAVSTRAASEAAYVQAWLEKVERLGNANYPQAARAQRLRGNVRLLVSITPNGDLHSISMLESSGQTLLDDAARRIVLQSAPFEPFTAEMRQDYDLLEIIRTFRFEVDQPLTTG